MGCIVYGVYCVWGVLCMGCIVYGVFNVQNTVYSVLCVKDSIWNILYKEIFRVGVDCMVLNTIQCNEVSYNTWQHGRLQYSRIQ